MEHRSVQNVNRCEVGTVINEQVESLCSVPIILWQPSPQLAVQ